jgi:hypothetical protein
MRLRIPAADTISEIDGSNLAGCAGITRIPDCA